MSETKEVVNKEEIMPGKGQAVPVIVPEVDIYENEDEILLYVDMPGVVKGDISVNIDNGKLMLSGVRKIKDAGVKAREEFSDVEYRRTFSVPQSIDTEKVNAILKDGVLRLHLAKSEAAKPRQIEINVV